MMYIYFGSDFKGDVPGSVEFVKRGRHRAQSAAAGLDCAVQDVDLGERRRGAVPLGVALPCGISTRAYSGHRGRSVVDLQAAINRSVAETKADPTPLTWTANPDTIIAAGTEGTSVRFYAMVSRSRYY